MGVEDFLLGRNFLRTYQVLVDLTSMKIVVRAPVKPVWHHAHTQVGVASVATPVALDSDLVLQPFERTVVKAKLVTNDLEPLIFQNVIINAAIADISLQNIVFSEDSVATVSEADHVFVSMLNLTSNPQRIPRGTQLATWFPCHWYIGPSHNSLHLNPPNELRSIMTNLRLLTKFMKR